MYPKSPVLSISVVGKAVFKINSGILCSVKLRKTCRIAGASIQKMTADMSLTFSGTS